MARPLIVAAELAEEQKSLPSEAYVPKAMPSILGTFDMTAICVLGIFYLINCSTAASGGATAYIYWIVGALTFFLPSIVATMQLGALLPHSGGIYNWTYHALGRYWSFLVGFCWWLPGPLLIVISSDAIVTYLNGLNSQWLAQPWQQGLAIIALLIFSALMSMWRLRTVQNVVNLGLCCSFLAVAIVGLAGIVWLLQGHSAATSFRRPGDWAINLGNIGLFGLINQAYGGAFMPLNLGGEVIRPRVINAALRWSALLVLVGYLVGTFSLLVIAGPTNGALPFAMISDVDQVFGKLVGNLTVIAMLFSLLCATIVYNYSFARVLFVGSVDQRLPVSLGRLNRNRMPANAVILQTVVCILFVIVLFMVVPYIGALGNPANLSIESYNITMASVGLLWITITIFLYVDLFFLYRRDRRAFLERRIVPLWLLWLCGIVGTLSSLATLLDSLFLSWIPQLIDNLHWFYSVGGLMLMWIIMGVMASMYASGQAGWQRLKESNQAVDSWS
jgi:amino acid transporter